MKKIIFRIDDRLLHGSVVYGWGETLNLALFIIADDRIRSDELEAGLYLAGVPREKEGRVLSITETAEFLKENPEPVPTMVLVPGPQGILALLEAGIQPEQVNLGGLHFQPDSREYLPWLFLTEGQLQILKEIEKRGVEIYCQDLPANPRYSLSEVLHA